MPKTTHYWDCDNCGHNQDFRQPELPQEDYQSEQNEEKNCPYCDTMMFFDDIVIDDISDIGAHDDDEIDDTINGKDVGEEDVDEGEIS